jgi:2OG-Fe(II) oxygenase superfamily
MREAMPAGDPPDARARLEAGAAVLTSLVTYLDPALAGDTPGLGRIARALAGGRLVVMRDAFQPAFARRMFECLDGVPDWPLHEDYGQAHFHYSHHNLYDEGMFPPDLRWCHRVFQSASTRAWIGELSGRGCEGPVQFSASWYQPGDHSLPHSDLVRLEDGQLRQVAFIWHLTRSWQPEWGGDFFWVPTARQFPPTFNTLYLFNVSRSSMHFVTTVVPGAGEKRLAINGWWTGPVHPDPRPVTPESARAPDRIEII